MRGAERPGNVRWTRPFLAPLTPLTYIAARQTFIAITDEIHIDSEIDALLGLTDNLPLAVNLVANVASSEGCTTALARLKAERTAALSDGCDKRSNLEISIELSLSSPRMLSSPRAQELLSLVSLLPDGISDADLLQSRLPIHDVLGCRTTLVRTSLAYTDHAGRLRVLAPIREYIQSARPPSLLLVRALCKHFYDLVQLWEAFIHRRALATDLAPRLVSNLGNMHQVLQHALDHDRLDLQITVEVIISLNSLNRLMGRGVTPLILRLPQVLDQLDDHFLHGCYITERLQAWQFYTVSSPETFIEEGIEHFRVINRPRWEGTYAGSSQSMDSYMPPP